MNPGNIIINVLANVTVAQSFAELGPPISVGLDKVLGEAKGERKQEKYERINGLWRWQSRIVGSRPPGAVSSRPDFFGKTSNQLLGYIAKCQSFFFFWSYCYAQSFNVSISSIHHIDMKSLRDHCKLLYIASLR